MPKGNHPESSEEIVDDSDRRSKIGYWLKWIKNAKKAAKTHWDDARAAYAEYELDSGSSDPDAPCKMRYPIYKFACDILSPAYYSKTPDTIAPRDFGIEDPEALTMSLIAERLSQTLIDNGNFDEAMIAAVQDYIHAGKATTQVIYATELEDYRVPLSQVFNGEAEEAEAQYYEEGSEDAYMGEVLKDKGGYFYNGKRPKERTQKITLAPVLFDEFLHTPEAKTWSGVKEVAFQSRIDYEEAEGFFNKDKTRQLPYTISKEKEDGYSSDEDSVSPNKGLDVWECFCLHTKKIYWVCENYITDFLLTEDDTMELAGFFPCPAMIFNNKRRTSLYTIPTFKYLESTIKQLNTLYERMFSLLDGVRRRAIVYGASPELINALNDLDGEEYISAGSLNDILEKGGIERLVQWVPVRELVDSVSETIQVEEHFKNLFYEWFGTPEILRGIIHSDETAQGQSIASDAANDKFKLAKKHIADLARDSAQLMLDLALKVFSDEKIARMVGWEYMERGTPEVPPSEENPEGEPAKLGHYERFPAALAKLRNDEERIVRLDFETDSTSFRDETREIARAQMIAKTITEGLSVIGGIENPQFTPIALNLLLSVVDSMGGSTKSEDMIKKAVADLEKAKSQPAPEEPDYEGMKLQLKGQELKIKEFEATVDAQAEARDIDRKDRELSLKEMKLISENQLAKFEAEMAAKLEEAFVINDQNRVRIESFQAQIQAQESMLEEIRLKQDSDTMARESEVEVVRPEVQAPAPQIVSMPAPNINLTFEMPKPGKRVSKMIRPDGTQTVIETDEAPDPIVGGGLGGIS